MPAKLLFHKENSKDGFLVYETEPQVRTLLGGFNSALRRVAFPYLVFVVRYDKELPNQHYSYQGVYRAGFHVYCRNHPLKSLHEPLCVLPCDPQGHVCTNHALDNTSYQTLEELANTVIASWYGMTHSSLFRQMTLRPNLKEVAWTEIPLNRICDVIWGEWGETLGKALRLSGENSHNYLPIYTRDMAASISANDVLLLRT